MSDWIMVLFQIKYGKICRLKAKVLIETMNFKNAIQKFK